MIGWLYEEIIFNYRWHLLWPGLNLWWASCVLVGGRSLPASLFERKLHGNGFPILGDDVGASLHSSIPEERCRFIHFSVPEWMGIVQCTVGVHAWLGSRFGASIDCRAKLMLTRSSHGSSNFFLVAPDAILFRSSWELTGRGSRGRSILHQVQN